MEAFVKKRRHEDGCGEQAKLEDEKDGVCRQRWMPKGDGAFPSAVCDRVVRRYFLPTRRRIGWVHPFSGVQRAKCELTTATVVWPRAD